MDENTNGHGPRTCSQCQHGYLGREGLFCMTYRELIDDERVAVECEAFEGEPANVVIGGERAGRNQIIRQALAATPVPNRVLDEVVAAPPSVELVAACEAYFEARHCVLWGMPFEIISAKGRTEAAQWLAAQIAGVGFVAAVPQ